MITLADVIVVFTQLCFDLVFLDEGPDGVFGTFTGLAANPLDPIHTNLWTGRSVDASERIFGRPPHLDGHLPAFHFSLSGTAINHLSA